MKLVSIPYFFSIHNTKCQLLLLHLTYAFVGRTFYSLRCANTQLRRAEV